MKKKLLLAVALVGALSLGSCVDNNESASVTAVRNAKAEQLKGLANLANAQAEAATIEANADAALKQAQAEYHKANAEYQKAQAAWTDARTETEKANAQAAQANAMIAMANAQEKVKQIAAESEIQLLNLKTQAIQAQAAYEKALLNQANQNIDELSQLYNTYKNYSDQLLTAQQDLADAKVILTQYQAQIINDAQFRKAQIAQNNEQIAKYEQNIVAANAQIDVYTKYTSADAQPAYDAARAELTDLEQARTAANNALSAAGMTKYNASRALSGSAYVQNINKMKTTSVAGIYVTLVDDDKANGRPTDAEGNWCAVTADKDGKTVYIPLFNDIVTEDETFAYEPTPGMATREISYTVYKSNYDLIAGGFKAYQTAIATSIDNNQGKALKDTQTAYKAAQTTLAAAQDAVTKAGDKATDEQKAALEQAKAAADAALTAQNAAEDALEAVNKEVADVTEIIKNIEATANANTANVKAYNDADLAYAKATAAYNQASKAVTEKQLEMNALINILNSSSSAEYNINTLKSSINYYNEQISNLKKDIIALENSTDDDKLIGSQEATIANLEQQITVLEKQVETAKATLEAAINAGSEE